MTWTVLQSSLYVFVRNTEIKIQNITMTSFCFDTFLGGAVFVQAFDELISGPLAEFARLSGEIGGDVKTQVCYMFSIMTHCILICWKHDFQ